MTKTHDEIKKAMLHCSPVSCRSDGCPYRDDTPKYEGDMPVCRMKLWHDMVCLIQQLEAKQDATVNFLRSAGCETCLYGDYDGSEPPCINCTAERDLWQWKGMQKEE